MTNNKIQIIKIPLTLTLSPKGRGNKILTLSPEGGEGRGEGGTKKGFTLIEIIITIVIWSILIIPIAFMVKEHIIGTATAADIAAGCNLARLEFSKVNNLSYADATLADGYNVTTTDYEGYNYDLNRSVNYVAGSGNNLKKVAVTVYEADTTRQLAGLTTYVADVSVGAGSGG